jgi:membrane-bound lytic murein transglycosylase A
MIEKTMALNLCPVDYSALRGFYDKSCVTSWINFCETCDYYLNNKRALRPGIEWSQSFYALAQKAVLTRNWNEFDIRQFIIEHFQPYEIIDSNQNIKSAFITGYYQPYIRGSAYKTKDFICPIYARPTDLISFHDQQNDHLPGYYAGRLDHNNHILPYFTRQEIECDQSGKFEPLVWVSDYAEAFLVHVQGSARIRLDDHCEFKLTYAGRNGHPYTSIGKILISQNHMRESDMTLENLKLWLRQHGQNEDGLARSIMWQNNSFIFFKREELDDDKRPIGGSGLGLNPYISVAADRQVWPYGSLFWLNAELPFKSMNNNFSSLVVNQDTGTAIIGETRFDLFIGTGDNAGSIAGKIRHNGQIYTLQVRDNVC